MKNCKSCDNCANRMRDDIWGRQPCFGWECVESEEDAIKTAENCEDWCPECEDDDDEYSPSASGGDYGPSNPWDAPGMSIRDFI